MDKKALEENVFELISYMVVSARNLLEEPHLYGPFRLVDAVSRLVEILNNLDLHSERLKKVKDQIDGGKESVMESGEAFRRFLEALVSSLVEEIEVMP